MDDSILLDIRYFSQLSCKRHLAIAKCLYITRIYKNDEQLVAQPP